MLRDTTEGWCAVADERDVAAAVADARRDLSALREGDDLVTLERVTVDVLCNAPEQAQQENTRLRAVIFEAEGALEEAGRPEGEPLAKGVEAITALARDLARDLKNLHDNGLIDASERLADVRVQALLKDYAGSS